MTTNNMQPLPANGQAQPLPAKWVIKVTEANKLMIKRWTQKVIGINSHVCEGYWITDTGTWVSGPSTPYGYEPITDSQFKAMVEGEAKPKPEAYYIKEAYDVLVAAGHHDLAAALKAKRTDIWPVDYAAIVLDTTLALYRKCYEHERPEHYIEEMGDWMTAVRNYLNNQK